MMAGKAPLSRLRVRRNESMLTVIGVPDVPGSGATIFRALAAAGVPISMIVQNAPDAGSASITFTVPRMMLETALRQTRAVVEELGAVGVMNDDRIARLSVAGAEVLEDAVGLAGDFFSVLAQGSINILAINSTADTISCIIEEVCLEEAVRLLSQRFGIAVKSLE